MFGYTGSIYEWSWWLRGMERFMIDLAEDPPLAEAVIRKVEAHTTSLALATARLGVDVLCMYDDAGTQRGMQISPAVVAALHQAGMAAGDRRPCGGSSPTCGSSCIPAARSTRSCPT